MTALYTPTKASAFDHACFMNARAIAADNSDDKDTPLGVLVVNNDGIVLAEGYNSLPAGVHAHPERTSRPTPATHADGDQGKYDWLNHAERKAVCHAARDGNALRGATMYALLMPCMQCAQAIIDAGIAELVLDYAFTESYRSRGSRWEFDFQRVSTMLAEAGVRVRAVTL
ncbi:MAG: deoxycytidylate deaminase [Proteobacteria bacterium]|nr:deoxycytidylate deaminase [Pseudomonadota bacterium]